MLSWNKMPIKTFKSFLLLCTKAWIIFNAFKITNSLRYQWNGQKGCFGFESFKTLKNECLKWIRLKIKKAATIFSLNELQTALKFGTPDDNGSNIWVQNGFIWTSLVMKFKVATQSVWVYYLKKSKTWCRWLKCESEKYWFNVWTSCLPSS